jgi:hypothetical protein
MGTYKYPVDDGIPGQSLEVLTKLRLLHRKHSVSAAQHQ